MRKLILQIDVSLDGFVAGQNNDTSWVTSDEAMNQEASDLLSTVDTILLGRVAYQQFVTYWPFADVNAATTLSKITRQINEATKLIFSRTLKQVEWGTWNNARLIQTNAVEEVAKMKTQPGKNLLLYAGADIISTFIRADLVDEYRVRVHPVVMGQGKPLFPPIENQMNLKLVRAKAYQNGAVLLDYQRDENTSA
jgi:dihydrofolate reductase